MCKKIVCFGKIFIKLASSLLKWLWKLLRIKVSHICCFQFLLLLVAVAEDTLLNGSKPFFLAIAEMSL
jgi:hypothetical protein